MCSNISESFSVYFVMTPRITLY